MFGRLAEFFGCLPDAIARMTPVQAYGLIKYLQSRQGASGHVDSRTGRALRRLTGEEAQAALLNMVLERSA